MTRIVRKKCANLVAKFVNLETNQLKMDRISFISSIIVDC